MFHSFFVLKSNNAFFHQTLKGSNMETLKKATGENFSDCFLHAPNCIVEKTG